jgi:DNA processing protein
MEVDARVEAWASLQLIPELTPRALFDLLKSLGGPKQVLAAPQASLQRSVSSEVAAAIRRGPDAEQLERSLAWLALDRHWLVAWDDSDYPGLLLAIPDPPPAFGYVGRRELLNCPAVAIVGSRHATPQGIEHAEAFAVALSTDGLTIVSGIAADSPGPAAASRSSAAVSTAFIHRLTAISRTGWLKPAVCCPSFRWELRRCRRTFRGAIA